MSAALTLVVLIQAGDAQDPAVASMTAAARQTLGGDAQVVVREVRDAPSDADAAEIARGLGADALAELRWTDPPRNRQAHLHVLVVPTKRWVDRDIGFAAGDAPREQGRTLGFAVASMLPERPPPPEPVAPAPVLVLQIPEHAGPAPPPPPRTWRGAVDATGLGVAAIGGEGGGLGVGLAGQLYVTRLLGLRLSGSARFGEIAAAQATTLSIVGMIGVTWRGWSSGGAHPFGLGARFDAGVMRQRVTHLSSDDPAPVREARWLPAADAMAEGTWLFTEGAAVLVSAGAEGLLGTADVVVAGQSVASLPPVHVLAEGGIRARF